jgi:autotransporter-associated beta strand protein
MTFTWSGAGPDNNWSDGANWVGGVAPSPGDHLVFPAGAAQQTNVNDYPVDTSFYSLAFTGTRGNMAYSISGNRITLGAGGITDKSVKSNDTLNLDIALSGHAAYITLRQAADSLALAGQVSDDGSGLNAGIVKSGPGDLALLNNNHYLGPTLITNGRLLIGNSGALGQGVVTVRYGATLFLTTPGTNMVIANPLILAGVLSSDAASGPNIWSGSIALTGFNAGFFSFLFPTNGTLTVSGTITGNTGFRLRGGTLILTANNAFTGVPFVDSGTLELANSAAPGLSGGISVFTGTLALYGGINVAQHLGLESGAELRSLNGSNTLSGDISINGLLSSQFEAEVDADRLLISGKVTGVGPRNPNLHKTGMGTLALSNASNVLASTEVADGVLDVLANGTLGSGSVTVDDGATLELAPLPGFGLSFKQPLSLSGSGFENEGALRSVNVLNSWTGPIQLMDVVAIGADSALALDGTISGDTLAKVGPGRLSLPAANQYSGATLVEEGELDLYSSQALASSSEGVTVYSGATLGLHANGPFAVPLTLLDHGLLDAAMSATWSGSVTLAGTAQVQMDPATVLALSGFVSGTSDARLQEIGGGTLELLAPKSPGTFATVLGPGPNDVNQIEIDSGFLILAQIGTIAASLNVSLADGFTPAIGQRLTIIHNLTSTPITGLFGNLRPGSTFAEDGFTFQLTYHGGAGYDVVVTRVA